mmetsp:Transcript_21984/g.31523  ORF Transcript_21984/g.31523 Transcript_21984/m.31523 type:complete len:101 (+) Transcript_21984:740-1042(+)
MSSTFVHAKEEFTAISSMLGWKAKGAGRKSAMEEIELVGKNEFLSPGSKKTRTSALFKKLDDLDLNWTCPVLSQISPLEAFICLLLKNAPKIDKRSESRK